MMNANDDEYSRVWDQFEKLAAATDIDRQQAYHADGMSFLKSLLKFTTIHTLPEVLTADDFSSVIVELRDNYRQWNQYLMSLMASYENSEVSLRQQRFEEFISSCIWVVLIEAAEDFVSSSPKG